MQFEKDLFISYAHLDNKPLSREQQGWITRFHESLDALLSMRMGQPAQIWRDDKLAGNDIFSDEILSQFPKTAVLLSVLSPRYIRSDWCTREVGEFCRVAEQSTGLKIGNKCRIVKIIKSPLDSDAPLPAAMKAVLGYEFYAFDEDHTPLELDPTFGAEMAQKYHVRIAKLAWEVSQLLKLLGDAGAGDDKAEDSACARATVYLAECSYDQREAREALDAELKCHGYRVLPDRQLARDEATYTVEVAEMLKQCQLSVHLVGSAYGAVPDGPTDQSIVVLQNKLAIQQSRQSALPRIIWLPEGTTSKQENQTAFLHQLQTDPAAQFGADLITSPEQEVIKGAVLGALLRVEEKQAAAAPRSDGGRKLIYLICAQMDEESTVPLRTLLGELGFDVEVPLFEGDAAKVRQTHMDLLKECSGVLVFYGAGGEAWKRAIDSELRKFRGSQGAASLPVYTYVSGPETGAKRILIQIHSAQLVNCLLGVSEDALRPFLEDVKRGVR